MIQEELGVSFQLDKGWDRFLNGRWFQLIFDIGVVSLLKLHKEDSDFNNEPECPFEQ